MNTSICATCDRHITPADNFCSHCGALVPRTGITAPLDRGLLTNDVLKFLSFGKVALPTVPVILGVVFLIAVFMAPRQQNTPSNNAAKQQDIPSNVGPHNLPIVAGTTSEVSPEYLEFKKRVAISYSLYYDRRSWEERVLGRILIEDFEKDLAGQSELTFPYSTGNKLKLEGQSVATIGDTSVLPTHHQLHLVDWQVGSTFRFPDGKPVAAFAFDYQSDDDWSLVLRNRGIQLKKGQKKFIGIVFEQDTSIDEFRLASLSNKGELSLDNLSFVTDIIPLMMK